MTILNLLSEFQKITQDAYYLLIDIFINKSNWALVLGVILVIWVYRVTYSFVKSLIGIIILLVVLYYIVNYLGFPVPNILRVFNFFIYLGNLLLRFLGIEYKIPNVVL